MDTKYLFEVNPDGLFAFFKNKFFMRFYQPPVSFKQLRHMQQAFRYNIYTHQATTPPSNILP